MVAAIYNQGNKHLNFFMVIRIKKNLHYAYNFEQIENKLKIQMEINKIGVKFADFEGNLMLKLQIQIKILQIVAESADVDGNIPKRC